MQQNFALQQPLLYSGNGGTGCRCAADNGLNWTAIRQNVTDFVRIFPHEIPIQSYSCHKDIFDSLYSLGGFRIGVNFDNPQIVWYKSCVNPGHETILASVLGMELWQNSWQNTFSSENVEISCFVEMKWDLRIPLHLQIFLKWIHSIYT